MSKIIEVTGLKKSYGSVQAVKGVDFYVESGKLFAFLGPNGAGKSTTIDIICTQLSADAGRVVIDGHVLGKDNDKIRQSIGVVFQDNVLDPLLTVRENLETRAKLYNLSAQERKEAIERACNVADVKEFENRRYGKLSGGQRRRADIARALVNKPKILFLDEPTTGLDPQTRQSVWNTIQTLQRDSGMTVFLTTHYMEEAANADYVIIIDSGKVTAKGTPLELKEEYCSDSLKLNPKEGKDKECEEIAKACGAEIYKIDKKLIHIHLKHTRDAIDIVKKTEHLIDGVEIVRGTMDDVFLNVTGKEIRENA